MLYIILGAEFHAVNIKVALQASEWVSKGGDSTVEQVNGHLVPVTGSNLRKSKKVWYRFEEKWKLLLSYNFGHNVLTKLKP